MLRPRGEAIDCVSLFVSDMIPPCGLINSVVIVVPSTVVFQMLMS